jgi:ABC-type sugar transport system permease subunit
MSSLPAVNTLRKTKKLPSFEKATPYIYILPAGLFLTIIMGYPIIFAIFMSFQKFNLATLVSKQSQFIGLANYQAVLANPEFTVALTHSLILVWGWQFYSANHFP